MNKVVIPSIAVVAAILISLIGIAVASHYEYLAEDPVQQQAAEGTENKVYYLWGLFDSHQYWWSEPSIESDVITAINNWTSAIPQLTWVESTESGANLVFRSDNCPGIPVSCYEESLWLYEPGRDASYSRKATIWINPDTDWGEGGRLGAIAHEIGHSYGLHERYIDCVDPEKPECFSEPPDPNTRRCNDNEETVMDTGELEDNGNGMLVLVHCDGSQGPEPIDVDRVTAYWSQGELYSFTSTGNGTVGTYTWKDAAWAELRHHVHWYYDDGSQWVWYHGKQITADVGVHWKTEQAMGLPTRTFTEVVDRTDYGAPAGTHMACGHTFHIKWNTFGPTRCTFVELQ